MAFPTGWTRRCALVVQHGQVPGDQTALPVLITAVCLPAEMVTLSGSNAAQSDGGDIRFSSDSAGVSQLACEIVVWTQNATPASAMAEIWVPINVLTVSDVTIYVWYHAGGGQTQPAANAAFGSQAVWDSSYLFVCHLNEATNAVALDSTSHGNNSSTNLSTQVTGKIGNAQSFNGTTEWIVSGFFINSSIPSTVSAWIKNPSGFSVILEGRNGGGDGNVLYTSSGKLVLYSGSTEHVDSTVTAADSTWHYAVATASGSTGLVYVDNATAISGTWHSHSWNDAGGVGPGNRLGRDFAGSFNPGITDELRVSNVQRSASWILTEYNSQNSPSTFIIPGTPAGIGGGGGTVSVTCSILISGGGAATTSALTCSIGIGYGGLATTCGTPPAATVGVGGFLYRPPVMMGSITLSPIYDLNGTLTWDVSSLPPGLSWDGNPSSSTYGNIVGTPTLAGTYFYAYTVSSPDGQRISNSCLLIVNPGAPGTGPFDIVACSIVIAPADDVSPCPPDAVGGPG